MKEPTELGFYHGSSFKTNQMRLFCTNNKPDLKFGCTADAEKLQVGSEYSPVGAIPCCIGGKSFILAELNCMDWFHEQYFSPLSEEPSVDSHLKTKQDEKVTVDCSCAATCKLRANFPRECP